MAGRGWHRQRSFGPHRGIPQQHVHVPYTTAGAGSLTVGSSQVALFPWTRDGTGRMPRREGPRAYVGRGLLTREILRLTSEHARLAGIVDGSATP